ncbi:MAG: hypothetical protein IKT63_03020 [Oscillospiraceae bacterium]|nr:hypothetical protein [Oscillospiraceae bacterium]
MKNFINTATAQYLDGEKIKSVYSNKVIIPFTHPHLHIWGETLCRDNCGKWMIEIYEKHTEKRVFCLNGYTCKGFCFEANPEKQYYIVFSGDKNSTMRLYNIPGNISLRCDFDPVWE